MSFISAGNTTTTTLVVNGDTTGNLVFNTGGANTTALTISNAQNATFAGTLTTASQGIAFASLPTGSVLQVVNTSYGVGASTTSSAFTATGLTVSITPKFATSKILVFVSQAGVISSGNAAGVGLNLYRNSTLIDSFAIVLAYVAGVTVTGVSGASSTNYLDSPATTSSVTYSTKFNSNNNSTTVAVQNNGDTSTITLMEIAA